MERLTWGGEGCTQKLGKIRSGRGGICSSPEKGDSAGAWQVFPITLEVTMEQPASGGHRGDTCPQDGEESARLPGSLEWLRAGQELGIQSHPGRTEHRQGESSQWLEKELVAMPGGKRRSLSMGHVPVHPPSPAPRCACTYRSCCRLPLHCVSRGTSSMESSI